MGAFYMPRSGRQDETVITRRSRGSVRRLTERNTAEKGFSLGSFEPDYVRRFAIALVRREGRTIAFANVTRGFERKELSGELMRYLPDAPSDVMSFLFIQMMLHPNDVAGPAARIQMVQPRHGAPFGH